MTDKMSENTIDAALLVVGEDGTVCILAMPEKMRGKKFESVGYDDEGFYLVASDGERYEVSGGMTVEDYEQSYSAGPFMLRGFIDGEIQGEEYQVDITPRSVMGFGA